MQPWNECWEGGKRVCRKYPEETQRNEQNAQVKLQNERRGTRNNRMYDNRLRAMLGREQKTIKKRKLDSFEP